jgi:hypothetical protein
VGCDSSARVQCPLTRIKNTYGVPLAAGKRYFLRIAPANDSTVDAWTFGQAQSTTMDNGDTLAYAGSNAPAFDVLGYAVVDADEQQ